MKRLWTALILLMLALFATSGPARALDACVHAPRSRLAPGMVAAVAPGLGPVNVRAFPAVNTGIRAQLYGGNRVTILSGPSCNGQLNWWRVETRSGVRGWMAEGTWNRYWLIPQRDIDLNRPALSPFDWSCPVRHTVGHCFVP
jgi:hypothetical protein